MDYNNDKSSNIPTPDENSLRLLSINKASKILGVRYQFVRKMVMTGKIKFFTVGERIKIPYMNLVKFIEEQTVKRNPCDINFISTEEISQKINELIAGYRKTNLN